jgi:hypothetical protein
MIVSMKRVLALALVGGALLLGGCDRQQAASSAGGDRPAATQSPAASASADKSDEPGKSDESGASSADVGSLMTDVDKQLSSDDQPPADQD